MALKTFNIDAEVYGKFSEYCKKEGISMSKKVERFIQEELERIRGKEIVGVKEKPLRRVEEHSFSKYC